MKKKCIVFFALFVMAYVSYEVSSTRMGKQDIIFSLLDIEKQAAAENINYTVEGKSNNPKSCTLEIWVEASGGIGSGEGYVAGHYKKVSGMENFCSGNSGTCDPYNCHQRI